MSGKEISYRKFLRSCACLALFVAALFFACAFLSLMFCPDDVREWTGLCGEFVAERYFNRGLGLASFVFVFYFMHLSVRMLGRQPLAPFLKQLPLYAVTAVLIAVNLNIVAFYHKMDCAEIYIGGRWLYDQTVNMTLGNNCFDFLLVLADITLLTRWAFRDFPRKKPAASKNADFIS